jgi:hypothetical protein
MHTKIIWFNLFLSFLIIPTLILLVQVLTDDSFMNPIFATGQKTKNGEWPKVVISGRALDPPSSFTTIRENNLFSRARQESQPSPLIKEPELTAPKKSKIELEAEPIKELPKQEIQLNGIILAGDLKVAFVKNPDPASKGPSQIRVAIGDTVGRYRVRDLQRESMIVEADSQLYEVRLFEKKERDAETGPTHGAKNKSSAMEPKIVTAGSEAIAPKNEKAEPEKKDEPAFEWFNTPFGRVKRFKK